MSVGGGLRRALAVLMCAGWLLCAASVTADPIATTEDIRDIRGPKSLQPPWLMPALIAAASALTAVGYWALKRRRRVEWVAHLLPHELAMQRLDAIRAQMSSLDATAFAVAASDVIRGYIEERFGVTATRRTTEEFLQDMLASPESALVRQRTSLNEFLTLCDYAKFAGDAVAFGSVDGMYRGAKTFVIATARQEPHDSVSST